MKFVAAFVYSQPIVESGRVIGDLPKTSLRNFL
jgi:hypothetical protein